MPCIVLFNVAKGNDNATKFHNKERSKVDIFIQVDKKLFVPTFILELLKIRRSVAPLTTEFKAGEIFMVATQYQYKLASIVISCVLAFCLFSPGKARADLTQGVWILTSGDNSGVNWSGTKLHFLTDIPNEDTRLLTGYFEWTSDIGAFGRENFVGTSFDNMHMILDGTEIVQPASRIVIAHYEADLTSSGTELINGIWTGNVIPGAWSAVLSPVFEPETYAMFLAGLGLVGFMTRRSQRVTSTTL